jgi:hypothetical protein
MIGLHPISLYWLNDDTILFSGESGNKPTGIYRVAVTTGRVVRLIDGSHLTPSVCGSSKALYFSWGPKLQSKTPAGDDWPTFNDYYGFHIWRVPLRDVLR